MTESEHLTKAIASVIREDLAQEAIAGFPLVKNFPDSETLRLPLSFYSLTKSDQEELLDALSFYATTPWSFDVQREKNNHPILRKFHAQGPQYPDGDWYGERPKKSEIKKVLVEKLTKAGFTKLESSGNYLSFVGSIGSTEVKVFMNQDPGFLRQLDYGLKDWMDNKLRSRLDKSEQGKEMAVIEMLSYEYLWNSCNSSCAICWDVVTVNNLQGSADTFLRAINRLGKLAESINTLAGGLT